MNLDVFQSIEVASFERKSHGLEGFLANLALWIILFARLVLEVRRLVHVQPDPAERHLLVQFLQLPLPNPLGLGVYKIIKVGLTRPNLGSVRALGLIRNLDEIFVQDPLLIGLTGPANAGVHQGHPVHFLQKLVEFLDRKVILIDSENIFVLHVVQISPNSVNRKFVFLEVLDNCFQSFQRGVAPSALVVAQRPERRQSCSSYFLVQPLQQFFGVESCIDVYPNAPPCFNASEDELNLAVLDFCLERVL